MSYAVRSDALAKARGAVPYGMDIESPGMLWGALVLAPITHGMIRSIDLTAARSIPGVTAIGPEDLPRLLPGVPTDPERPIFPSKTIQYHAQPIAAVAAPTLEVARRAAQAVKVETRQHPAVESIDEAAIGPKPEVIGHVHARYGDLDGVFRTADFVLTETYRTNSVSQVALEPHAAIAEIRDDGTWFVRTSTQSPFGVREDLAAMLGIPESQIVVEGTWVGGGFGGKGSSLVEPYALVLAHASGRPVRLALTYREEFLLGRSTLPSLIRLSSAVRGGTIVGRRVLWKVDAGSSLPGRDFATGYGVGFTVGPYRVPAIELEGIALRTHKPPLGPHRAPLAPQCAFAAESHMDHLAQRLGVDSVEFRRRHVWLPGDLTHLGQTVGPFGLSQCLAEAGARARKWRERLPENHGIGVGAGFWSTGTGAGGEARLFLQPERLRIVQGEPEIGSGSVIRGLAAVAEVVLGIPRERIEVDYRDTATAPFDSGVWGSRTLGALGQAVEKAARELRAELAKRTDAPEGAIRLTVQGSELAVEVDGVFRPVREILRREEIENGGLTTYGTHYGAAGSFDALRVLDGTFYPYTDFTGAAHVAEVALDPELGTVRVVRYAAFHDAGRVVDFETAKAQVEGGIVMGLGTALTEEGLWSPEGVLQNPGLVDYRIPTLAEVPPIEVHFIEGFLGAGPFGAKGLGEPPIIPVPATIANAVRDACGEGPTELPMTGERLARHLKLLRT